MTTERELLKEIRDSHAASWGMSPEGRAYLAKIDAAIAAPAAASDPVAYAWQSLRDVLVGYVLVPKEILEFYQFADIVFVPVTSQQEQLKISLDKARKAIAARKPPVEPT